MNFVNFQIAKMSFLSRKAQKADEKDGVICLVFMSPSRVMVIILLKIVPFLQFFADVSKKSKAVIAIYVYASESSRLALLENGIGYYTTT